MNWYVSVFTADGFRLIWASGPVDTLSEATKLAHTAKQAGFKTFLRSPIGEVREVDKGE